MIQNPPKFTGTVDLDGDETPSSSEGHEETAPMASGVEDNSAAAFADEFDRDHDFPEDDANDLAEEAARRKRNANLITYGGGAAFFLVILVVGYFQFSSMFAGKPQPHPHAAIPVPTAPLRATNMTNGAQPAPQVSGNNAMLPPPPAAMAAAPGASQTQPTQAVPTQAVVTAPIPYQPAPAALPAQTTSVGASVGASVGTGAVIPPQTLTPPQTQAPQGDSVPAAAPNLAAKLDDLTGKVAALQASIATLTAQQNASPQLQQIQNSIESVQHQVSWLLARQSPAETAKAPIGARVASSGTSSAVKPSHFRHTSHGKIKPVPAVADSGDTAVAAKVPVEREAPAHLESGQGGGWILRAATPGSAMIGKPGSNDLQHVSVGDTVSGLGRITSIDDAGGRWVVKGTSGSIGQ